MFPNKKEFNKDKPFIRKTVSFGKLTKMNEFIIKPYCQGSLDLDKVDDLVKSYKNNIIYHQCRNNLTFGCLEKNDEYVFYNVDGQHRLEMALKLFEEKCDDCFEINFVFCNTMSELKELFNELNKDSNKNKFQVNMEFDDILNEIKYILNEDYNEFFAKRKSSKNKLYTIEEFIEILNKYKKNIEEYDETEEFIKDLIIKNKEFNLLVNDQGYSELKNIETNNSIKLFYDKEREILKKKKYYTFAFKNNNFIDDGNNSCYLFYEIEPYHELRKEKDKIGKMLRRKVWIKEFNKEDFGICPVYKCKNILGIDTCHIGHIVSSKNGGNNDIDNLRPICMSCNLKMSDTNWKDYERKLRKQDKEKLKI
jgi:hypothetical protein